MMPDRNVYIMNLKDTRKESLNKNSSKKFEICYKERFVAIGWGTEFSRTEDNYRRALKCIQDMKKGDIVWVRNPKTKERYLCEILGNFEDYGEKFIEYDISQGIKCKFYKIECKIEDKINPKRLVSISTVRAVKQEDVIEFTKELFANSKETN